MAEPIWVEQRVILVVHDRQLAEHGGSPGIRDAGLLESALSRPVNAYLYETPDLCDLAALYAAGIARNHPFIDGNKRTAFMAAYIFLRSNRLSLHATEDEATATMLALASGSMTEQAYADWLRSVTRLVP
jgi:death-on-curing protein